MGKQIKINGKKLAWAIIFLVFFCSMVFMDFDLNSYKRWELAFRLLFNISLFIFFGWRFIENLEETFT